MFGSLQHKLLSIIKSSGGKGRLKPEDITNVLDELQQTLIDSDVHIQVAQNLCQALERKLSAEKIFETLTPEQTILKCIRDELCFILGEKPEPFTLPSSQDVRIILLVGLYGVGKTTHSVKLAHYLKENGLAIPFLVSCDSTRPAAHEQLLVLAQRHHLGCMSLPESPVFDEVKRIKEAKKLCLKSACNTLIIDTAGRSSIDKDLIHNLHRLITKLKPHHILLTLDAMQGQSSLQVAQNFHTAIPLTGTLITKCDSDAKGGVALSARLVTQRPIFFLGTGERTEDLESFDPKRMANRILDFGDVAALLETASHVEEKQDMKELARALKAGSFHFGHFKEQLSLLKGLGSLQNLMKFIPGMGRMMHGISADQWATSTTSLKKFEAIIDSMTSEERKNPKILNGSRKKRISQGSGTTPQDVNFLLQQFETMKKMTQQFWKGDVR